MQILTGRVPHERLGRKFHSRRNVFRLVVFITILGRDNEMVIVIAVLFIIVMFVILFVPIISRDKDKRQTPAQDYLNEREGRDV